MRFHNSLVYIDANIVIYAIEGFEQYRNIRDVLLKGLDEGRFKCLTSELTLAEVLVKPYREQNKALISTYHSLLAGMNNFQVVPITRETLLKAASFRAERKVGLPDAIHLATAVLKDCDFLLTNDGRLGAHPGISILQISEIGGWGPPGVHEAPVSYKTAAATARKAKKKRP